MAQPVSETRPRFFMESAYDLLCARLSLSHRESQIVRHLFGNHKESHIADELGMSAHTLRTHVERLYRKLGVANRAALAIHLYESFLALTCEPDTPLDPVCSRYAAGTCPFRN